MKIKYLGSADIRVIPTGDDFGGLIAEPVAQDIVWNRENRWVVDTTSDEYSDVPDEVWEAILDDREGFQDVTGFKRLPLNDHQRIFLAMKDGDQPTEAEEKAAAEEREREREARRREAEEAAKEANRLEREAAKAAEAPKKAGGRKTAAKKSTARKQTSGGTAAAGGGGGTTVGGSTAGGGGGGDAGGTTVGGSS